MTNNPLLSIIIPSFNRKEKLLNTITQIREIFQRLSFINYEIVAVNSGFQDSEEVNSNVKIIHLKERLYPGIARNLGLKQATGQYVWFIDDDDNIIDNTGNLLELLNILKSYSYDITFHSLKNNYSNECRPDLVKNISLFKEKQEVFNFVFKRQLANLSNIVFSDGLHEDIKYTLELIINSSNSIVLNKKLYEKIKSPDSITFNLTNERIAGYLQSLKEILELDYFIIQENKENIIIQFLGVILYLINKAPESSKVEFLEYLTNNINPSYLLIKRYGEKSTNFKYAVSLFLDEQDNYELIKKLDYCFKTHLSCKDLKHSLFLGPQEIIGCCKRFFYKGKQKGDIILFPAKNDISLEQINDKKSEIELLINQENYEECLGCPYIERFEKKEEKTINYISLENFSYCNMKCSYCSPRYYAGKESIYDAYKILDDLKKINLLADNTHIVFGGGEPTINPKFKETCEKLINNDKVKKIRILSNSLKFSENVNNFLENDKIHLVTSIDAGTQDKFKEIRGKGEILKVLENLSVYNKNQANSKKITLKYIITEDNCLTSEIQEFVRLVAEFGFQNNFIQISCNFKLEKPTDLMLFSIYELAGRLLNNGFKFVYFDDLIRDRLQVNEEFSLRIIEYLNQNNIFHPSILTRESKERIILWGTGYQSHWIKNKTLFGKSGGIVKIINNETEINDLNFDYICPAGIQLIPEIYRQINNSQYSNKLRFYIFI